MPRLDLQFKVKEKLDAFRRLECNKTKRECAIKVNYKTTVRNVSRSEDVTCVTRNQNLLSICMRRAFRCIILDLSVWNEWAQPSNRIGFCSIDFSIV